MTRSLGPEEFVMRSARYNRLMVDPDERFLESRELMMGFRTACIARDGRAAEAAVRTIVERSLEYLTTLTGLRVSGGAQA